MGFRNVSDMSEGDGSEDVNDFLQRIRQLGDERDREDEERTKRLEAEIIQGRRERQARRAGTLKPMARVETSPRCGEEALN